MDSCGFHQDSWIPTKILDGLYEILNPVVPLGLELSAVRKTSAKPIGTGSYANVYEVMVHGTRCAAKEMHPILLSEPRKRSFLDECVRCSRILHPNVVQFLGIHYPSPNAQLPWLVMEMMHISLTGLIEKYEKEDFPLHFKLSILMDTCQGIRFLHSQNIVHRDLSSNNILLTKHLVAKVSDLGVAKAIPPGLNKHTMAPGTVAFMPPEALVDDAVYGLSIDVFSVGCVCIHIVCMEWPMPKNKVTIDEIVLSETKRREHYLIKMVRYQSLKWLAEQCLQDAMNRPLIGEVMTSLQNVRYDHHKLEDASVVELFSSVISLSEQITEKNEILTRKDQELIQREQEIKQRDQHLDQKDQEIVQQKNAVDRKDQQLVQKDQEITLQHAVFTQQLKQKDQEIVQKDCKIDQKDQELAQKDREFTLQRSKFSQQLQQKDQEMAFKDHTISLQNEQLKQKDEEILLRDSAIDKKDQQLVQMDQEFTSKHSVFTQQLKQRDQEVAQKNRTIDLKIQWIKRKDQEITKLTELVSQKALQLEQKNEEICYKDSLICQELTQKNQMMTEKNQLINEMDQCLVQRNQEIAFKNDEIEQKDNALVQINQKVEHKECIIKQRDGELLWKNQEIGKKDKLIGQMSQLVSQENQLVQKRIKMLQKDKQMPKGRPKGIDIQSAPVAVIISLPIL